MNKLFCIMFVIILIGCKSEIKKEVASSRSIRIANFTDDKIAEIPCTEDSLVKTILNNDLRVVKDIKFISNNDIKFTSGYTDDFSYTQYQLFYKEYLIEFVDSVFEKSKQINRSLYLNKIRLNVCRIKNSTFNLDSLEMHIVYTESEIYTFKTNSSCLIVVSHPMNWVGRMTSFSFYQLINLKDNTVIEFIKVEE